MTKTTFDLSQELKNVDEFDLIELLNLTSEDIVNRFEDVIEAKYDKICRYLSDDLEEDELPDEDY